MQITTRISLKSIYPDAYRNKAHVGMSAVQKQIRFGIISLEKGFITSRQLGEAVSKQLSDDLEKGKHRLIGEILVDMGFMTVSQVEEVLEEQKKGDDGI